MRGCADQVKRCTLELGGKSANVIFADADIAGRGGQRPVRGVRQRRSGLLRPVADPGPGVGVLRSSSTSCSRRCEAHGRHRPGRRGRRDGPADLGRPARAGCRATWTRSRWPSPATRPSGPGFWLPPSVVLADSPEQRIWREEVFGPVVAVLPFADEAEAVALANDTEYGLSGSIFTRDLGRALRVSRAIQSGNLSVNSHSSVRYWTPFGGYKQSGLGRELGPDAPDAFTEEKNVFFATPTLRSAHGGTGRGPGGRGHRRLLRDRAGQRPPAGRRGRHGGDRRRRRGPRTRGGRPRSAAPSSAPT